MSEYLTVQEVADRFRCSSRQVIRLIDSGRLSAVDLGVGARRRLVVCEADILEFETNNRAKAKKKPRPKPRGVPQYVTEAKIERARKQLSISDRQ